MTENQHCTHCPGPDDPAHEDEVYLAAERACAFYEDPEHLRVAGPRHSFKASIKFHREQKQFVGSESAMKRLAELTRLGEEIGDLPPRVCLTHHSINVCRHAGECLWSENPEDVKKVMEEHRGTGRQQD